MISIITTSFNSENVISNSLLSILNQNFIDFEIVSIDGKSSDNTCSVINSLLRDNDIIISETDSGIYDALNKGITNATGNIIGILHSDDAFSSNKILQQVINIFEETNCDGVYGDLNFVKNGNIKRRWKSKTFKPSILNSGWMPAHPTLFLKKDVFEKHGLYDTQFKIAADYDLILRIFKDDTLKFEYLPVTITNMSIGGVSTSGFKNLVRKSYEDYMVLKKHKMKFPILILFRKIVGKIAQFYAI